AALFVLGLLYSVRGSCYMCTSAGDFKMRWAEQHYVFRGKDPSLVWERQNAVMKGLQVPARVENATLEPDLGLIEVPYPPWAYATGALFAWPSSFQTARVLFAAANLVTLALPGCSPGPSVWVVPDATSRAGFWRFRCSRLPASVRPLGSGNTVCWCLLHSRVQRSSLSEATGCSRACCLRPP